MKHIGTLGLSILLSAYSGLALTDVDDFRTSPAGIEDNFEVGTTTRDDVKNVPSLAHTIDERFYLYGDEAKMFYMLNFKRDSITFRGRVLVEFDTQGIVKRVISKGCLNAGKKKFRLCSGDWSDLLRMIEQYYGESLAKHYKTTATEPAVAKAVPADKPLPRASPDSRHRYTPTVEAVPADKPLPRASPDLRDRYNRIVAKAEDTASTGSSAGDAVRALFADSTSIGTTSSSKPGWMYTRSDNTTLGRLSNGDMDEGTWRISKEGWFCRTWKRWADGKEGCWQVELEKNNKYKLTPKAGVAQPYVIKILQGHDGLQYRRYH